MVRASRTSGRTIDPQALDAAILGPALSRMIRHREFMARPGREGFVVEVRSITRDHHRGTATEDRREELLVLLLGHLVIVDRFRRPRLVKVRRIAVDQSGPGVVQPDQIDPVATSEVNPPNARTDRRKLLLDRLPGIQIPRLAPTLPV